MMTGRPEEYRRNIVGDNESNINDRSYGNSDLMSATPMHGTHCAGIIAGGSIMGIIVVILEIFVLGH